MPYEEIEIRIDRDGYVFVDTRGLPADRVRALSDHLQEVFGPKIQTVTDPAEMPPQIINLDQERTKYISGLSEGAEEVGEEKRRRLEI